MSEARARRPRVAPVWTLVGALVTCIDQGPHGRDGAAQRATVVVMTQGLSTIDMALEVVTLPVSDVDRAKRFYQSLGWRMDIDLVVSDDIRTVQVTPPTRRARSSSARAGQRPSPGPARE
jgi:hypothetical protein